MKEIAVWNDLRNISMTKKKKSLKAEQVLYQRVMQPLQVEILHFSFFLYKC